MISTLLPACVLLYLLIFPSPVFAAVTLAPVNVDTSSPVIGDAFSVTASMSGAFVGNIYFLKCRIGANSSSLNDGQTFNSQTVKWLDDTGLTGAWIDMPQITIGGDGTWQGAIQCKIKNGSADESKMLFMRACLNSNNNCGTSFQSSNNLMLSPQVPTATPTPTSTPTNTLTPTPTPTATSAPTATSVPTATSTSIVTPTRIVSPTPTSEINNEIISTDVPLVPAILGVEDTSVSGTVEARAVSKRPIIIAMLFVSAGLALFAIASLITKIDI